MNQNAKTPASVARGSQEVLFAAGGGTTASLAGPPLTEPACSSSTSTARSPKAPTATAPRTSGCPRPSSFGLTRRELRAEILRCHRLGWQLWELRYRFVHPREISE